MICREANRRADQNIILYRGSLRPAAKVFMAAGNSRAVSSVDESILSPGLRMILDTYFNPGKSFEKAPIGVDNMTYYMSNVSRLCLMYSWS